MDARRTLLRVFLPLLVLGGVFPSARGQTKVGDTKDACDGSDVVMFRAKGGEKVKVKANGDETGTSPPRRGRSSGSAGTRRSSRRTTSPTTA